MIVYKIQKEDFKLKEKMFLFSLPVNDEDTFMILDKVIQGEVDTYIIYNFPETDELYINEEEINKMMNTILGQTLGKLSPVYMNKLKYIYNEEVIEDIVFGKVRDAVLQYSIEINGTFRDLQQKKYPVG